MYEYCRWLFCVCSCCSVCIIMMEMTASRISFLISCLRQSMVRRKITGTTQVVESCNRLEFCTTPMWLKFLAHGCCQAKIIDIPSPTIRGYFSQSSWRVCNNYNSRVKVFRIWKHSAKQSTVIVIKEPKCRFYRVIVSLRMAWILLQLHWRFLLTKLGNCLFMVAGIGQTIIFSSCFFLLSFFFSSPNLSGQRLDVYHTSTHGVALVRI